MQSPFPLFASLRVPGALSPALAPAATAATDPPPPPPPPPRRTRRTRRTRRSVTGKGIETFGDHEPLHRSRRREDRATEGEPIGRGSRVPGA
ncbi:hypothetical protein ACH49_29070 [Streptomyces leeuwenhoekii]|uniref:Secreted protein n=1 Tax=Streptomyces leeuwenhoekii TaxID=1437453 RepID=A0ABR5HQS4_STRLW|nr:hypothetical protein ACH49_29070 [Streptomyces leeuwenhoekii]